MTDQDNLPHWRQGTIVPEQDQTTGDQYRNAPQTSNVERQPGGVYLRPERPEEKSSWSKILGFGLLGLLAMATLVGLGYFLAQSGIIGDEVATTGTTENDPESPTLAAEPVDDETAEVLTGSDETAAADGEDGAGTVVVEGEGGETTETGDGSDDTADDGETGEAAVDGDSGRTAVFRGGKVYLRGAVPSQEVAELIAAKAGAVVGPDNVVVEYEIDPEATIETGESTPLYVEDVVLFGFASAEIAPDFYPLLDLGTALLLQNPQASVTVVTHTDAVGTAETNLEVATERADAVADYWIESGVSPDQIETNPRGEADAADDADEAAAQLERRAEFVITGLLD